jgi:hypothetical protein
MGRADLPSRQSTTSEVRTRSVRAVACAHWLPGERGIYYEGAYIQPIHPDGMLTFPSDLYQLVQPLHQARLASLCAAIRLTLVIQPAHKPHHHHHHQGNGADGADGHADEQEQEHGNGHADEHAHAHAHTHEHGAHADEPVIISVSTTGNPSHPATPSRASPAATPALSTKPSNASLNPYIPALNAYGTFNPAHPESLAPPAPATPGGGVLGQLLRRSSSWSSSSSNDARPLLRPAQRATRERDALIGGVSGDLVPFAYVFRAIGSALTFPWRLGRARGWKALGRRDDGAAHADQRSSQNEGAGSRWAHQEYVPTQADLEACGACADAAEQEDASEDAVSTSTPIASFAQS